MTNELPEIFDHAKPQPAPPELRPRVLSAVERELARRKKPRWERALEWGVAACLALGVGLNLWQFSSEPLGTAARPAVAAKEPRSLIEQLAAGEQRDEHRVTMTKRRVPGPFDARYAELLTELVKKSDG